MAKAKKQENMQVMANQYYAQQQPTSFVVSLTPVYGNGQAPVSVNPAGVPGVAASSTSGKTKTKNKAAGAIVCLVLLVLIVAACALGSSVLASVMKPTFNWEAYNAAVEEAEEEGTTVNERNYYDMVSKYLSIGLIEELDEDGEVKVDDEGNPILARYGVIDAVQDLIKGFTTGVETEEGEVVKIAVGDLFKFDGYTDMILGTWIAIGIACAAVALLFSIIALLARNKVGYILLGIFALLTLAGFGMQAFREYSFANEVVKKVNEMLVEVDEEPTAKLDIMQLVMSKLYTIIPAALALITTLAAFISVGVKKKAK